MKALFSSGCKGLLAVIFLTSPFCAPTFAQQPSQAQVALLAARQPLITQPVDEAQLIVLKGNTHPLARPEFDLGTAPATLPMQRMLLVLKRSAEQESALRKLLDDQQDKASPNYHKWLTPDEFGRQFGPTDADIQTITSWLQAHGFQVGSTKGRTVLEFSGSASQVREAFHTTIHKYVVNGEQHWANAGDPAIPAALTPAVAGVLTLHNFLKKPTIQLSKQKVAAKIRPGKLPELTFSDGTHALSPADFATIYNINPVGYSGGTTVAVVARSNLHNPFGEIPGQDVRSFRQAFLPSSPIVDFQIILNGPDPGDLGGGEEAEVTLDTTWSGAVDPSATIAVVVSASTNTADGVDLSEVYIIEHDVADVMTESFSTCEALSTSAQAAGVSALAEQAAAQGITYFVSTGDNGAEGCDDQNAEAVATGPVSVNLLASTPFNVAVGGTVFNDSADSSRYWSSSTTSAETALSYIPEDVWNDSCPASSCGSNANIVAGSGGASIFFSKPPWQAGVTGIIADNTRDLPDVSLTASPHDGYVLCLEGSCVPNAQGYIFLYLVGGTSAAAPSFAGIMALLDSHMLSMNPQQYQRQGQANYVLYRLAIAQNGDPQCNGSNTSVLPASTCVFNDVTVGNNAVPGEISYGLSGAQYQAGVGYDMATGLGSVNVANLVNEWNNVRSAASTTKLTLNPTVITHGSAVNVNITVSPSSGTGSPSGDVSLVARTGVTVTDPTGQHSVNLFTLDSTSSVASTTNNLPGGGPYLVIAHYAGDLVFVPSDSDVVSVTVTPEPSATTVSALTYNSQGAALPFTSGPFGSLVYLRADVAGLSGHGAPTGSVTFVDTFGTIPGGNQFQLNAGDQLNSGSNTATPNGIFNFDTGTHTVSASYSGDASFNSSSTTQSQSFTITPGFLAQVPLYAVNPVVISTPGSSGGSAVNVTTSTGFSGTIALSCSKLPAGAACQFSPSSITGNGTLTTTLSTITVATMAPTAMLRTPGQPYFLAHWIAGGGLLFSMILIGLPKQRRARGFLLLLMLALIVMAPACGSGGGGSQGPPPNPGTPKGTYNVVVNATSGSTTSSSGFTLVVQ